MGHIASRHPEIDRIEINPWPSKPTTKVAIMRVESTVVGVGAGGAVYCNQFNRKACYGFPWRGSEDLLIALVKLGKLPAKIYDEHCQRQDKLLSERDRKYAAERVVEASKELGLKLTKPQWRKIDAALAVAAVR